MTKKQNTSPADRQDPGPAGPNADPTTFIAHQVHTLAQIVFRHLAASRGWAPCPPPGTEPQRGRAGDYGPQPSMPPSVWSGSGPRFYW